MAELKHQLRVIMFTDIVGYTAIMGEDEKLALVILHQNKDIHTKWMKRYNGTWLKEMGDGVLSSFESITDAVYCAGAILSSSKNVKGLRLRIGIHLGDVVIDGKEIYGDGVNIASRIQAEAEENQIVISDIVHSNLKNKKEIVSTALGARHLKNVDKPVAIYSVRFNPDVSFNEKVRSEKRKNSHSFIWIAVIFLFVASYFLINFLKQDSHENIMPSNHGIRSLAVLPFYNLTGDLTQENLISGMQDNLITTLAQIKSLDVISRTSTLHYKEKTDKNIQTIARELNVDAIIEASVLGLGDSVRINVQFIQAFPKEKHLWSRIFDRPFNNILYLFDDVAHTVADNINKTLNNDLQEQGPKTVNSEAYKAYLNGKFYSEIVPTIENQQIAIKYFERSIELDSTFAPAYGGICWAWISLLQIGGSSPTEAIPKIFSYNQKALELDPNYPEAQYHKAVMSFQAEWDWEKSEKAFLKAINLNPNYGMMHSHYGHLLMYQQKWDEAIDQVELGIKVDPLNPHVQGLAAVVYWHHGDFDKAMAITAKGPDIFGKKVIEESIAYLKGDYKSSLDQLESNHISDTLLFQQVRKKFNEEGYPEAMRILAQGLEEHFGNQRSVSLALLYSRAGMTDDAIRILETGYSNHHPNMPYAFVPVELKNLESDPRYRELARKMNLPY